MDLSDLSDLLGHLMRAQLTLAIGDRDFSRFRQMMESRYDDNSLLESSSESEDESSTSTIATPTSVADYRRRMQSVFDKLKRAAKTAKDARDSPDQQNLTAYANLIKQIAKCYVIVIRAPRENRNQLKKEMANFFLDSIIVDSESTDYFSMIADICCKTSEELLSPSNEVGKLPYEVVLHSLVFFHNSTDYSPNFSKRVVESEKLMKTLLALINRFAEDHVKGTLNEAIVQLLISACGTVYNVVRLSDADNIMRVRQFGFIEAVKPFLETTRIGLKDVVMLIMIFAASEDTQECCSHEPTIKFLVDRLKGALTSEDKSYEGYSSIELLEAFQKLAVIDENKKLLAKCGCRELMKSLLEDGEEEELPHALGIITQLAFDKENAKWFHKELQKLLDSKFLKSENQNLRERAMKLKWVIEEKTDQPHTALSRPPTCVKRTPSQQQQHIMISYQHGSRNIVKKLVYRLKKEHFKVWVDYNDLQGNMTDAMTSAVDNASVVLVCMSLGYKDSDNCKMEAEYAKAQKKPIMPLKMENWKIDGWLKFLIGQEHYLDFSSDDAFEENIGDLLTRLRSLRGSSDSPDGEQIGATSRRPQMSQPPQRPAEDFSKWDKSKVQDWCRRKGIPGEKCKNLTGKRLKILKTKKDNFRETYDKMIEEFKFSLSEEENFDDALDAL